MAEQRITAEPRTEFGKGAARRVRRAGKVPAVLYGHGTDPRHLSLPGREFEHVLKTDAGLNVLLELDLGDGRQLALPKSVQRDPLRGYIEHVDLLLVRRGEKVTVDVAVHVTGTVAPGGLVDQPLTSVGVVAEATNIPQGFEVSVEGMQVGTGVHARDIPLPSGVQLHTDPDAIVLHVLAAPTAQQLEEEIGEAEAALGAGAVGAGAEVAAQEQVEGAAAKGETGRGDVVPDTESGEGGPATGQTPRE